MPPNEEKTQILRVVVRETLSLDMIDRLVTDLCNVTESMMNSDAVDLAAWQPAPRSVEVRETCSYRCRNLLTGLLVETTYFGGPALAQEGQVEAPDEGGGAPKRVLIAAPDPMERYVDFQMNGPCLFAHYGDARQARVEGLPVAQAVTKEGPYSSLAMQAQHVRVVQCEEGRHVASVFADHPASLAGSMSCGASELESAVSCVASHSEGAQISGDAFGS